jgi:hypothetical protein
MAQSGCRPSGERELPGPKSKKGTTRAPFCGKFGLFLLFFDLPAVLATELVHATAGIDDLLLASVEGMALGANFHVQFLTQRGASGEVIATTANNLDFFVLGVDIRFHDLSRPASTYKKGAKCNF